MKCDEYITIESGETWTIEDDSTVEVACCDCGLIHQINIKIGKNNDVKMTFWTLPTETWRYRLSLIFYYVRKISRRISTLVYPAQ